MEREVIERERTAEPESEGFFYGFIAEFEHPEDVVAAARRTHEAGYRRVDAYSPFPVDGLSEALDYHDYWVPLIMLTGGILGALAGFGLLYYCMVISYPINVGGEPLYGWPIYVPITFECTILLASLSGLLGMFLLNRLPQPYHPVFEAAGFDRATTDRFFLCIESSDPHFDGEETRRFMESLGAMNVSAVNASELGRDQT
jgi:Alternative complex III, ActD subunit